MGQQTLTHTYPSPGNYIAFFESCCRISNCAAPNAHINNPDGDERTETIVNVGTGNSSPVSNLPPIVICPENGVCSFQIPATDPDGDPLTFRLSTSAEAGGFLQPGEPGSGAPNPASIDPNTGVYTWDTTGATLTSNPCPNTLYSTQVMIEDGQTKVPLDFLIQLVAVSSMPPRFDSPPTPECGATLSTNIGSTLTFTVQATDPVPAQTVTLNVAGLPAGATMTPPLPTTGNPVSSTFSWTPTPGQQGNYVINFTAIDNTGAQEQCSFTIEVAGENCSNGIDDDGDGFVDCDDPDCACDPACAPSFETDCTNRVDDDCDGLVDCFDPDCGGCLPISRILPNKGGDIGTVTVLIYGIGLIDGATVKLVRAGQSDIVGDPVGVGEDGKTITTAFDCTGKERGPWDVVVTNPDGTSGTFAEGFIIEEGQPPQLRVNIVGRNQIRVGREATYKVMVENLGNVDANNVEVVFEALTDEISLAAPEPTTHDAKQSPRQLAIPIIPPYPLPLPGGSGMLPGPISVNIPVTGQCQMIISEVQVEPKTCEQIVGAVKRQRIKMEHALNLYCNGCVGRALTGFIHEPTENWNINLPPAQDCVQWHFNYSACRNFWGSYFGRRYTSLANLCTEYAGADCGELPDECNVETLGNLSDCPPLPCPLTPPPTPPPPPKENVLSESDRYITIITDTLRTVLPSVVVTKDDAELPSADAVLRVCAVGSIDPNEKVGPRGVGAARYISGKKPLGYIIFFENLETASAAAQEVLITDHLDISKMDLDTFSLGPIAFGDKEVIPPPGLSEFTTDVDLRPDMNLLVRIDAQLNKSTGVVTWRFTSIDPDTGGLPDDPLAGFLPPNVTPPEGEGSVMFTVMPKEGLTTGTEIRNKATIVFDVNPPIETNEWLNTIDNTKPESHVLPLPASQDTTDFTVEWTGDGDEGSGIKDYTIFVSENGGPYTAWLNNTTDTLDVFTGQPGKTYDFYSVARDNTGNQEDTPGVADATTSIPILCQCPEDGRGGCISGTVTMIGTGEPVAGKTVILKRIFPKRPRVRTRVITDSNGCYQFTDLGDGVYKIKVRRRQRRDCIGRGGRRKIVIITGGMRVNDVNFECKK